ncbi:hypothetical protein GGR58DRAFT_518288 [Xylaria digitata]|nr:hypothetical protein GGR58DRAFT_518288 [Xylaria digitata]
MSTQDVQDVVAEVEQLLSDVEQNYVDVNQLEDELDEHAAATTATEDKLRLWKNGIKERIKQLASRKREIEEQSTKLKLKNTAGKFDVAELRRATQSWNQARFDNALHWLLIMEEDETLDRLRNMSPHHKAAILDLERQITVEKLDKSEEFLRLRDAEVSRMTDNIRTLEKDNKSLESRVADLTTSKASLQQQHDSIAGQRDAAQTEIRTLSTRVQELEDEIAQKTNSLIEKESKVAHLAAVNNDFRDRLMGKDARILELGAKLDSEKTSHESTRRECLDAELAGRHSRREVDILHGLVAEGLAEINRLEDEVRDTSDAFDDLSDKLVMKSAEYYLDLTTMGMELSQRKRDSDRKDADLTQANADLLLYRYTPI